MHLRSQSVALKVRCIPAAADAAGKNNQVSYISDRNDLSSLLFALELTNIRKWS